MGSADLPPRMAGAWLVKLVLSFLQLVFDLAPLALDTGIQVWNSVEINEMISDPESGYGEHNGPVFKGCPSGWKQHGKQCYYFGGLGQNISALAQRSSDPSLLPQSWKEAEELCQDEEAHLTSVRTEEERRFVSSNTSTWIGAQYMKITGVAQTSSNWMWADQSPWEATSSTSLQLEGQTLTEDNQCGFLKDEDLRSGSCNEKRPFVCSKPLFKAATTDSNNATESGCTGNNCVPSNSEDMWQVVVGAFGNSGPLSNVELFPRPSSPTCSIPDLPQPRVAHSLSLLSGGRLVVCGGHNGSSSLDSCNSWVAGNNSWTPLYTMSMRRYHHMAWTAQSLPNSIILLGGVGSRAGQTAETVPAGATFSLERMGYGGCGIPDGETLVLTGGLGHNYVTRYNVSGFVEELPRMPEQRYGHACGALPTGAFIVAGGFGSTRLASVEPLLPGSEAWTTLASLPRALYYVHASVVGETLWVVGGWDDARSPRSEVVEYRNGKWSEKGNLQIGRSHHSVITIGPEQLPCLSGLQSRGTDIPANNDTSRIQWTNESKASLTFLQLPAVFLAILGLCKAATQPDNRLIAILKCLIILIIPLFLLEFLHSLIVVVLQLALSKSLAKANLIWFLGKTDRRRILGLDMARVFCGTVLQLLFQLILLLGFTPWSSVRPSQLFSICSSMLCVVKTATEVMTFKEEEEQEERTIRQALVHFFQRKFDLLRNVFRLLPLLLTNAVFNIGTASLLIAVVGTPAYPFLLLIFFGLPSFDNLVDKLGFYHDSKLPSVSSGLLIAWTNFFVLTGQAERKASTFFCLLARFVFNIVALIVIVISFGFTETDLRTISVISIVLGVCGLVFLSLFCNSEWSPRKTADSGEGKTE